MHLLVLVDNLVDLLLYTIEPNVLISYKKICLKKKPKNIFNIMWKVHG
jgi:hypothetical protein